MSDAGESSSSTFSVSFRLLMLGPGAKGLNLDGREFALWNIARDPILTPVDVDAPMLVVEKVEGAEDAKSEFVAAVDPKFAAATGAASLGLFASAAAAVPDDDAIASPGLSSASGVAGQEKTVVDAGEGSMSQF